MKIIYNSDFGRSLESTCSFVAAFSIHFLKINLKRKKKIAEIRLCNKKVLLPLCFDFALNFLSAIFLDDCLLSYLN